MTSDAGEGEQVVRQLGRRASGEGWAEGRPRPESADCKVGVQAGSPRAVVGGLGGAAHPRPGLERDDRCQLTCFFLSKLLISESFLLF